MDIYFKRITAHFLPQLPTSLFLSQGTTFYEQICEKFKVTSLLFYDYFFRRHFTTPFCNYTDGLITQKKNKFALWSADKDVSVFLLGQL